MGRFSSTVAMLPAAALLSSLATSAGAAPQILAVVASLVPVPLTCAGGDCVAELTTICLTEHRASPGRGTPYQIHQASTLTLTGTRPDGTTITLALPEAATFNAERSHLSARITIPSRVLNDLGVTAVSVRANRDTTLVPTVRDTGPRPLDDAEIALAAGPLRAAAATILGDAATNVAAAQLTTLLINALPEGGRVSDASRAGVWQRAVAAAADTFSDDAVALAAAEHDGCQTKTRAGAETLRGCLGSVHDALMGGVNKTYWDTVSTGS